VKPIYLPKEELEEVCKKYPTPFHLYDEKVIRARARRLMAAFSWNPGFREYFAVKANPNPAILGILREEGLGVDCASLTELMLAGRSGFSGEQIAFNSNVTPEVDMKLAACLGARIGLDDISHIDFLSRVATIPENVTLRFNPGNSFTIGNSIMSRPAEAKFGFTRPQLAEGVRRLMGLGARRFGLHAFLSSNTTDPEYYPALARLLFGAVVELADETGARFDSVNLSGGIGIPYRDGEPEADIQSIGRAVEREYRAILEPAGHGHISIHTELGRWLVGPAGCLVSRVIHTKHIYKNYLGLDACSANLLRPAMYHAWHDVQVSGKENDDPLETWDITGGLCENNDKFAIDRKLPPVGIGDLVIIHDTGAHCHSMGYNYNGKLRSAELLLTGDGSVRLIRRAETPADYFATLDLGASRPGSPAAMQDVVHP
jgi:diaminopimelate decarboxylase